MYLVYFDSKHTVTCTRRNIIHLYKTQNQVSSLLTRKVLQDVKRVKSALPSMFAQAYCDLMLAFQAVTRDRTIFKNRKRDKYNLKVQRKPVTTCIMAHSTITVSVN